MKVTRGTNATMTPPADWFTGTVHVDTIAEPQASSRASAHIVHFGPGARTAWHTHPHGQTIHVTEGAGRCQKRGEPVEEIRAGDSVYFEPGEEHWHGAGADRFMAHIAIADADDSGTTVTWGDHVSDEEYGQQPA